METSTTFRLNGETVALSGVEPQQSLLRWLRTRAQTGTKEGCADGDCGACTVVLVEPCDGEGRMVAVNSCLLPMGTLPGREVLTIEALAEGEVLHPVQVAMVECGGSQCGYCTPGIVMSLFAGVHAGELSDHTTEGNLCRCTGYRPIREATAALRHQRAADDRFRAVLAQPRLPLTTAQVGQFHSPDSVAEALALKQQFPEAAFIAGGTDLGVSLSRHRQPAPVLIGLDRILELQQLELSEAAVRIGAGVPLSRIERELAGVFDGLDELLPWFAARQVRNRATLGGNLGSASPIGDLAPWLLAMEAEIECVGLMGARSIPVAEFFLAYRRTALAADELIAAVTIPRRIERVDGFYKIAKRQTDDISVVAAALAIELDVDARVCSARLAFGGVAATPVRACEVENSLLGRRLDADLIEATRQALREAFSPLSDHRASAEYRRALCGNLFARFAREKLGVEGVA